MKSGKWTEIQFCFLLSDYIYYQKQLYSITFENNLVLSTRGIKTIQKNGAFASLKKAGVI